MMQCGVEERMVRSPRQTDVGTRNYYIYNKYLASLEALSFSLIVGFLI